MMGHTGLDPGDMTINVACPLGSGGSSGGGVQQCNEQLKYTLLNLITEHKRSAQLTQKGLCTGRGSPGAKSGRMIGAR